MSLDRMFSTPKRESAAEILIINMVFYGNYIIYDKISDLSFHSCKFSFCALIFALMIKENTALADRAKRARRIIKNPALYKVCFGCDSIVASKVNICPNCHAYRFELDQGRVVAQAKVLSTREQNSVAIDDLL